MSAPSRNRLGWWLYVAVLAGAVVVIATTFLDLLALGLFGYYATRPVYDRLDSVVDSDHLAATLTVLTVLVPVFLVAIYAGLQVLRRVQQRFDQGVVAALSSRAVNTEAVPAWLWTDPQQLLANPPPLSQLSNLLSGPGLGRVLRLLGTVFDTLLLLGLATTLAYGLLRYDDALANDFAQVLGGPETTVYAYGLAVDDDLESIFFGNLLFVLVMSVVATAAYAATNFFAPQGLQVPLVLPLGFLTGVASLIPIVVGKVVYLPVVAYLALSALGSGGRGLGFVAAALVGYILVLDILPQTFVQPYVTGQQLNTLVLLFAYILGPVFFGWYGFFLMPIVFVLVIEAVRIVLPELLHGEPLDRSAGVAEDVGASPADLREDADDGSSGEDGSAAPD